MGRINDAWTQNRYFKSGLEAFLDIFVYRHQHNPNAATDGKAARKISCHRRPEASCAPSTVLRRLESIIIMTIRPPNQNSRIKEGLLVENHEHELKERKSEQIHITPRRVQVPKVAPRSRGGKVSGPKSVQ